MKRIIPFIIRNKRIQNELWNQVQKMSRKLDVSTKHFTATCTMTKNPIGLGHIFLSYVEFIN